MLYPVLHALQPLLVPLCFLVAWGFVILMVLNIWAFVRDSVARARQMHRIPCAGCRFFTGDYHLKCTVHPSRALSEEAIGCQDFEPARGTLPWIPTVRSQRSRS